MTRVVTESYAEDRAGIGIVAYRTQGALAFWPLLLLTARLRRPRVAVLAFVGVFFVLAQQILFQKRAPTFRIALFLLVFLVVLPWLRTRPGDHGAFGGPGADVVPGHGERWPLLVALAIAPWLFTGQTRRSGRSDQRTSATAEGPRGC